ncbi:hypothetical protein ACLOJK_014698 [Asimina triloba]
MVGIDPLVLSATIGSQRLPASTTSPEVEKKVSTDVGTHPLVLSTAANSQRLPASIISLSRFAFHRRGSLSPTLHFVTGFLSLSPTLPAFEHSHC